MGKALVVSVCFSRQSGATFFLPAVWTGGKRKGKSLTFWFVMRGLTMKTRVLWPKMGMISSRYGFLAGGEVL